MQHLYTSVVIAGVALMVGAALAYLLRTFAGLSDRPRRRRGMTHLSRLLDMPIEQLRGFQPVYRQVRLAKQRGGVRILAIPDSRTRRLQRRLLRRVLGGIRIHATATGFERGRSIVHNAAVHARCAVVIRMDLVDFFPSTRAEHVEAFFRRIGWQREAAAVLTRLCTHDGGLPQGAVTSPRLSNLVNIGLDARLDRFVLRRGGLYTRYADDITISFPRDPGGPSVRGTIQGVRRILATDGYRMHGGSKLRILRRHQQQRITGLVVNDRVQLPRKTRRWLRAVRHRLATGRPTTLNEAQIRGWLALEHMVNQQAAAMRQRM